MISYIQENICDVVEIKVLKSNRFRTVYLVNNKLVVMFSANAKLIFNWYIDNQKFAPTTMFGYDECICYDYLVPTSDYLKKAHISDFIKSYRPKLVSISDYTYYDTLEARYSAQIQELGIKRINLKRPYKEGLYQLHGNMDLDHTIVFDKKLILLDPRPVTGALLYDIINMYVSSIELTKMFKRAQLAQMLNCNINDVNYYYTIILVNKLYKLSNNNDEKYNKYHKLIIEWSKNEEK